MRTTLHIAEHGKPIAEDTQVFVLGFFREKRIGNHRLDMRQAFLALRYHPTNRLLIKTIGLSKHNEIRLRIIPKAFELRRHEVGILEKRQGHKREIGWIMEHRAKEVVCWRHNVVAKFALVNGKVLKMRIAIPEKIVKQYLLEYLWKLDTGCRTHHPDQVGHLLLLVSHVLFGVTFNRFFLASEQFVTVRIWDAVYKR